MEYKVLKVLIDGTHGSVKYLPQRKDKKIITFFCRKEKKYIWKNMYEFLKGTDIFIPCYYDTEKEAWDRIEKHKEGYKIASYKYHILDKLYK